MNVNDIEAMQPQDRAAAYNRLRHGTEENLEAVIERMARAMLAVEWAPTPTTDLAAQWARDGDYWLRSARAAYEAEHIGP